MCTGTWVHNDHTQTYIELPKCYWQLSSRCSCGDIGCLFPWPVAVWKLCLPFSSFPPPPGSSLRFPSIPVELPSWFPDRLFWPFTAELLYASDGSHPPLTGFNYLSPFEFPWQLDLVRGLSLALGKLFVGPRLHKIHGICFRFELLGRSGQPTTSAGWLTFLARGWVGGSCASCDKLDLPCSWSGVPIPCLIPLWIGLASA